MARFPVVISHAEANPEINPDKLLWLYADEDTGYCFKRGPVRNETGLSVSESS